MVKATQFPRGAPAAPKTISIVNKRDARFSALGFRDSLYRISREGSIQHFLRPLPPGGGGFCFLLDVIEGGDFLGASGADEPTPVFFVVDARRSGFRVFLGHGLEGAISAFDLDRRFRIHGPAADRAKLVALRIGAGFVCLLFIFGRVEVLEIEKLHFI